MTTYIIIYLSIVLKVILGLIPTIPFEYSRAVLRQEIKYCTVQSGTYTNFDFYLI